MELSRDEVAKAAAGFGWDDLCEGRFVELGYYGDGNDLLRIGLHRDTEWRDPHLLSLVPPPDRWYRRAVAHVGQMVADRTPNSAHTNASVTRLTL